MLLVVVLFLAIPKPIAEMEPTDRRCRARPFRALFEWCPRHPHPCPVQFLSRLSPTALSAENGRTTQLAAVAMTEPPLPPASRCSPPNTTTSATTTTTTPTKTPRWQQRQRQRRGRGRKAAYPVTVRKSESG